MKLKRTIAVSLKEDEKIQVPDGELWVGYIDNNMVVEIVGAGTSKVGHWGYGHELANASSSKTTNVDTGRTRRFYATPGSQIAVKFSASFTATFAFTCLVFDISKEVKNV